MSIRATNWASQTLEQVDLSASERLLLLILAHFHNAKSDQCTPSVATLAKKAGLSERRVQMNIRRLERLGLLKVVARIERGQQTSNQYQLVGVTKKSGAWRGDDGVTR